MEYMVGCLIGHPNQIPNHLIINASFINSFFLVIFNLFLLRSGGQGNYFKERHLQELFCRKQKLESILG